MVISIIVPTYREADNIEELVSRIAGAMSALQHEYQVIIVDDDSGDGTAEKVDLLKADGRQVTLITRVDERGLSSAVLRGFRESKGDVLVCMDADLSHPPEAIPKLIECLEDGQTEFVLGSRYVEGASTDEGWGVLRWLNSKVATLLARPFVRVNDPMSGFFAMRRDVFERADELSPIGYKIGLELMVKCGCANIREVPIHFSDRKHGQSKLTLAVQWAFIKHLKRLAVYKCCGRKRS